MTAPLARIPFSPRDEGRIDGASRWMRFIAVVQIVGSIIGMVVLVIVGSLLSLFGAQLLQMLRELATSEGADVEANVDIDAVLAAPLGIILLAVGVAALAALVVQLWAAMVLYRAGDNFAQVAATDIADQDFLADGFANLKTYFYVEAAFAVLAAANAVIGLFGMGGVS